MAEFLIKAISATHPDPLKDARGCYKRGDIVDVRPDGFKWGKEERLPKFVIVKIPGLDAEKVKKYMQPHFETGVLFDYNTEESPAVLKRRLHRVLIDDVPAVILDKLKTTGTVTVSLSQIRNYVQNKFTQETGLDGN